MHGVFNNLLSTMGVHPVLIDIGASGGPPRIWNEIAEQSIYMGFDPDRRQISEVSGGRFFKSIVVNEAVISESKRREVLFYLTRSPHCSSTLKPDQESLSNYLFSDLFLIEQEKVVQASRLDLLMERFSLSRIHWFKTDSQGIDLRLFRTLKDEIRSQVLAVDVEPGLIDAYLSEDLFIDTHRYLTENGFWLSNLNLGGAIRMKRSTLHEVMSLSKDINAALVERTVKKSPAWCEARYLKKVEALARGNFAKIDCVLLWIFALLDGQIGFALDLAIQYQKMFGKDDISKVMKQEPILRLKRSGDGMLFSIARSLFPIRIKRWLKALIKQSVSL
jgi:hypothetical protein